MLDFFHKDDNQFGLRRGIPQLGIYAIKVINYYYNLNTLVSICFTDIKSALDSLEFLRTIC